MPPNHLIIPSPAVGSARVLGMHLVYHQAALHSPSSIRALFGAKSTPWRGAWSQKDWAKLPATQRPNRRYHPAHLVGPPGFLISTGAPLLQFSSLELYASTWLRPQVAQRRRREFRQGTRSQEQITRDRTLSSWVSRSSSGAIMYLDAQTLCWAAGDC